MAIRYTWTTSGVFFKNPVPRMHREIYGFLEDAANEGAATARSVLRPGHGYLTGELHDSIVPRPVKATRRAGGFSGRYRIVAGSRGFEPVRYYMPKTERKFHYMRTGARAARSYFESHRGTFQSRIARAISG